MHEQRWLPSLAATLPIPIAAPIRFGGPFGGYPWPWSICPWFDGDVAADVVLADPMGDAERLGCFVDALHRPAPADAPENPFRGQPLSELVPRVRANLERLDAGAALPAVDTERIRVRVDELAGTAEWAGESVWLHGDLHSANLVVADGRIVAVLDFGDLTSGDPAVDLAVAWMLFDGPARDRFRVAAGQGAAIDDATWDRARLWGIHFGLLYLAHSADSERFARMANRLLRATVA